MPYTTTFLINTLKQHIWTMYFFVLQKFAEIQKDYEGDKIVVYRDSPSEGLTKLLFHYAKWEIIKKKIITNLWHKVT